MSYFFRSISFQKQESSDSPICLLPLNLYWNISHHRSLLQTYMQDISPAAQDSPTSAADGGRSRLHTKIQELVNDLMVLSGLAALKHQKSALCL